MDSSTSFLHTDPRCSGSGQVIPTQNYCDQPYVVRADDGAWVCVVTTGAGHEGEPGQIVTSLRSVDHGQTWEPPVPLEPAGGAEASYAVVLKVPSGRIYAFYNHNTDRVREIPREDGGIYTRVDSLGHYVFKFSDNHGRTWSPHRYEVPVRCFEIDRENPFGGKTRFFWNVGRPLIASDGAVYLPHSKVGAMGVGFYSRSEGVFLRSANILTEADPDKVTWETFPDGEIGLRPPAGGGRVAEEHTIVELSDGSLYTVYRTIDGYPSCSCSRDRGLTWDTPSPKQFCPDGRRFKHPRAANFVWKISTGRYLYWFHNHGGAVTKSGERCAGYEAYLDRNPAWISAGREEDSPRGKIIVWSEPEILLYDDDLSARLSYPDLIEEDGRFWVTETQKTIARVHVVAPDLLEILFNQHRIATFAESGLLVHAEAPAGALPMPALPEFRLRRVEGGDPDGETRRGFTFDFILTETSPASGGCVFDTMNKGGAGVRITLDAGRRLVLEMSDSRQCVSWASDCLTAGDHRVTLIIDGGPRVILVVVDGHLQDGGDERQFGWGRFSPTLLHANGDTVARVSSVLRDLRIYNRALRVSEAVGNYAAARRDSPDTIHPVPISV
jgi:hypothetical protein